MAGERDLPGGVRSITGVTPPAPNWGRGSPLGGYMGGLMGMGRGRGRARFSAPLPGTQDEPIFPGLTPEQNNPETILSGQRNPAGWDRLGAISEAALQMRGKPPGKYSGRGRGFGLGSGMDSLRRLLEARYGGGV